MNLSLNISSSSSLRHNARRPTSLPTSARPSSQVVAADPPPPLRFVRHHLLAPWQARNWRLSQPSAPPPVARIFSFHAPLATHHYYRRFGLTVGFTGLLQSDPSRQDLHRAVLAASSHGAHMTAHDISVPIALASGGQLRHMSGLCIAAVPTCNTLNTVKLKLRLCPRTTATFFRN